MACNATVSGQCQVTQVTFSFVALDSLEYFWGSEIVEISDKELNVYFVK